MEIESIEVIPMNKESIFNDMKEPFEVCGLTTSLTEWMEWVKARINHDIFDIDLSDPIIKSFIENQSLFMTLPFSKIGSMLFESRSILVEKEQLEYLKLDGPLHNIYKIQVEDKTKEMIHGTYMNMETFKEEKGMVYPKKNVYRIRYGMAQ